MKVVAINSSPRKESNTEQLINYVFEGLEREGIETELIKIGGKRIWGWRACSPRRAHRRPCCTAGPAAWRC